MSSLRRYPHLQPSVSTDRESLVALERLIPRISGSRKVVHRLAWLAEEVTYHVMDGSARRYGLGPHGGACMHLLACRRIWCMLKWKWMISPEIFAGYAYIRSASLSRCRGPALTLIRVPRPDISACSTKPRTRQRNRLKSTRRGVAGDTLQSIPRRGSQ